jgi:Tol biopolymer transport system component
VKHNFLILSFILIIAVSGCSVEIPASPSPVSSIPAFSATPQPTENAIPITVIPGRTPTAIAVPTPVPLSVTWSGLNLTGKLLYNTFDSTLITPEIHLLDLTTGARQLIFHFPNRSWTDAVVVSPDGKTLLLSYSPPSTEPYGGQQSIYAMPLDASKPPQLLVIPPSEQDQYSQPEWSPDGKTLYFAHINYESMQTYDIMRMAYPDGTPEKFVEHAYWPRPSLDGQYFLYVSLDPDSGINHLFIANADGSDAHEVPVSGLPVPQVIDVPMLSPDNKTILFSSPDGIQAFRSNWFDKLLGVQRVYADGTLPSDWWSVPVSGGTAKSLTQIHALALYGVYSPDRNFVASYSSNGIFVMRPDGTELAMIVNDIGGALGTVNWIP